WEVLLKHGAPRQTGRGAGDADAGVSAALITPSALGEPQRKEVEKILHGDRAGGVHVGAVAVAWRRRCAEAVTQPGLEKVEQILDGDSAGEVEIGLAA